MKSRTGDAQQSIKVNVAMHWKQIVIGGIICIICGCMLIVGRQIKIQSRHLDTKPLDRYPYVTHVQTNTANKDAVNHDSTTDDENGGGEKWQ